MDKKPVDQKVKKFVDKLQNKFSPEKIIMFGSRVKGDAWKRSDYDFIIVSKKFEGVHWLKRISGVVQLWDNIEDIDVLPYTPAEFEEKKKDSSVVRSAIKSGKVINTKTGI